MDHDMHFNIKYFLILFLSSVINISVAEEIRDYYAEPGLNPFKQTMQDLNESIDPFSGTMQQKYTDIVIPGNGGLDIRINRNYTSPQNDSGSVASSAYGVGWTIHFGRIVTSSSNADKLCAQGLFSVSTKDNPSLELPDGGRELLVLADPTIFPELGSNAELITRSNWKAKCGTNSGLDVTDPTGTVYTMNEYAGVDTGTGIEPSWFTSRIEDVNGNWIAISYITSSASGGHRMIDEITSSDGRIVKFNYIYPANDLAHLDTITAHYQTVDAQTWKYNYVSVDGWGAYQLIEVVRPDGNKWQYDYNLRTVPMGKYGMNKVTYPQGGIVEYTYDNVIFNPGVDQIITTVVSSKTTSGTSATPGTWTYNYAPGSYLISGTTQKLDVTTVTTPTAKQEYFYYGAIANAYVWATGLMAQQVTYDVTGTTILDVVTNTWDGRKISNENYWHGRTKLDIGTNTPILLSKSHWRDGANYNTDYINYDRFGNPAQIVESGNYEVRTTDYLYYTDPTNWIIADKVSSETIQGIGSILREFNIDGTLKSESKYGVLTEYTYHPTGDLATVTDAKGKALGYNTKYNDYYRGIARQEIHPVTATKNITTSKVVNPTGSVKSIKNGRGFSKNFTYDNLNRLKTITYPKAGSSPVSINYTATSKTLTRGNLQQSSTVNGFGQTINTTIKDTLNNITISTTQDYDAIGQLTFKSHPNDTIGTSFQYDALGRQTRINHPDSTFRVFDYIGFNDTMITDERNNQTTYWYRAFGNPSEKSLIRIESPELIATAIYRNHLDQITKVWQGESGDGGLGFQRVYEYTPNYFLQSISNPEIGITLFGRDEIGNMTSKQVGISLATSYSYDFQNRNTFIDYPNTTADVTFGYDDNGNSVQVDNQNSTRAYLYDENDNLKTETINIGQTTSLLEYTYTNLDYVDTLTYPSGKIVNYFPDALGRPTQMAPYLTNVSYYPSGQTKQLTYANGQVTDYTLNNRLWVEGINVGNVNQIIGLTYGYDGLGNVSGITDSINTLNDRTFGYDGINRLTSADGQWGTGNYTYDKQGNLKTKIIGNHNLTYYHSNNSLIGVRGSANGDFYYDDYGNQYTGIDLDLGYNDASQLKISLNWGTVPAGVSPATEYLYDGNGMRVNSVNGATTTDYLFASNGNLMREYGASASQEKEYFYLGSQQIAMVSNKQELDTTPPVVTPPPDITVEANAQLTIIPYGLYPSASAIDDVDGVVQHTVWNPGPYPVGTFTVLWRATDAAGNIGTATHEVTVQDTTAPVLSVPVDVFVTSDVALAVNIGVATATDIFIPINISNDAPTLFPVGVTTVTWTATDTNGVSSTATQTVTISPSGSVVDTTPPVVTPPADILVEATGSLTSVSLGSASAMDDVNGTLAATTINTGPFTLGSHTITWSATDTAGNEGTATQIVTVQDTSPPVLTLPDSISVTSEVALAVNIGAATATDIFTPVTISNDAPVLFPVGVTTVTWTATDANGNTATAEQYVFVVLNSDETIIPVPQTLTAGTGSMVLASSDTSANGNAVMLLHQNLNQSGSANYQAMMASYNAVSGWSVPEKVCITLDCTGLASSVSVDDNGNVIITGKLNRQIYARHFSIANGWGSPVLLDEADWVIKDAKVQFDGQGNAIAVWMRGPLSNAYYTHIWASRYTAATGWEPAVEISNPTLPLDPYNEIADYPVIATNANGQALVVWEHQKAGPFQVFANFYDPQLGWQTAKELVSGLQYVSTNVALNDNGQGAISISAPDGSYVSRFDFNKGWLDPVTKESLPNYNFDFSFDNNQKVNSIYGGKLLVDQVGNVFYITSEILTNADNTQTAKVWSAKYDITIGWQAQTLISVISSASFSGINISASVGADGNVYALWNTNNNGVIQYYNTVHSRSLGWASKRLFKESNLGSGYAGSVVLSAANEMLVILAETNRATVTPFEFSHEVLYSSFPSVMTSDATPPVVTAPAAITIEANAQLTTLTLGTAAANDDVDGALTATADNTGPFAVGTHTVTWSASDAAGNVGTATQTVTVTDTTAPAVIVSGSQTVEATGQLTSVTLGAATATDIVDGAITPTPSLISPFTVGTHIVIWTATDAAGNMGSAAQLVTVTDTTAPTITVPANVTLEATGTLTTVTLGAATASDLVDGALTPTADNVGPFAIGTHTVTWSAMDAAGNVGTATQVVIIIDSTSADTTPPVVTAPENIIVEASGALTTVSLGSATANDLVDGVLTPIADNVGPYAVGTHTVTWSATDAAGNVSTATQTVTITDTTSPVVTAPAAITVEANATLTTVALGSAAANDSVDGTLTPTADNSGPFAIGTHTITWSATDAASNVGSATQLVTVQDTTPPVLTVPADVAVISDVAIAADIGSATATDIFTPVTVTNNAPAIFPVGVTTVTWTATDVNDNASTANQTVTVEVPPGVNLSLDTTSPQTVGAVVNLSAATVGVTGSYEYRFRVKGPATGDVWQVLQAYSATSTYAWNTTAYAGKNRIQVQARPVGTTDVPLKSAQTFWVNSVAAAQAVDYTTNIASPQTTGAVVNINAQATGGTGSYEYQFRVKKAGAGNAWVLLQDWSTLSAASWNTTAYLGNHRIQVKARNVNSTDLAVKIGRNYWVNDLNPATSAAIATDLTSPQAVGSTVVITGTGTGGTSNYDYRFRIKGPSTGDVWQVLQDWSAVNTTSWNTTGYVGSHRVQVQLKNAGTEDRPVRKALTFVIQ